MSLFVAVEVLIDGGGGRAGPDVEAGRGKQEEVGDLATSELVSPVGLESPFGRADIEEGGVNLTSEVEEEFDDVEDEDESGDGEGAPKVWVSEEGAMFSFVDSFVSTGTNLMVDLDFGLDGIGVGGEDGTGVGVEYGALCTICRLKHS